MATPNPEPYFDGEFYEENSFLVLAKGDELSAHSSPTASLVNKSVDSQNSQRSGGNASLADPNVSSVPKPLPRSNAVQSSTVQNGNAPIEEPLSSHFGSLQAQDPMPSAGGSRGNHEAPVPEQVKKSMIDQPEVSLASIISSSANSSITPSEADSLEESLKLIHILKTENEGLKEILGQRNETLRDEIKSIHSTSAMYESKHADQLQKYDACMKAIAELRAENAKLKDQLSAVEQAEKKSKDDSVKLEALEEQLKDKESQIISFQNKIQLYVDVLKDYDAKILSLSEQAKIQKTESESLLKQRDAIQFDLTDAKITIANLSDELKKYKGVESQANSISAISSGHLESALHTARQHLTNMKEDNEKKNALIMTLTEQKQFCEAQMKEFEANFKEERDENHKLSEALSMLQIELEKTKSDLVKKSEDLEKLHQTHLVLVNEHLNSKRENAASPPGSDEFVFINRRRETPSQNVRNEQLQSNSRASPTAPIPSPRNAGEEAAIAAAPPQVQEIPLGTCPLCFRQFSSPSAVERHAANCGMTIRPGTNPFLFP